MQSFHESIRTNVPLHPLLLFFNIVLNIIPSAVYLVLLIMYCHFDLSKRAILWILVFYRLRGIIEIRVIIGFVHGALLYVFVMYYFVWKRNHLHQSLRGRSHPRELLHGGLDLPHSRLARDPLPSSPLPVLYSPVPTLISSPHCPADALSSASPTGRQQGHSSFQSR